MLNIDQELLTNLNVKNVNVLNSDIFEVKNIIDKYEIKNSSKSPIHTVEIDNEVLVEYIIELYVNNKNIPHDISFLIQNNVGFRLFLLTFIKQRMRSVINDDSIIVYKEIFIIINLLSMGRKYEIFTHYNFYSTENITKLFKYYEKTLSVSHQQKDLDEFELVFQGYLTLFEVFNELCIINSLDVQRRKSVSEIVDCMIESISSLKSKIKLDSDNLNKLNNILGKFLLYFSYIPYMNVENKNVNYIIQEYSFMLKKLIDGYKLLRFHKNDMGLENGYYITFLDRSTTLILTLMLKLQNKMHTIDLDKNAFLLNLIVSYNSCSSHKYDIENISYVKFKMHLLNNYLYIYNNSTNKIIDGSYEKIIDEFIKDNIFCSSTMMIIHNIVLFDNSLTKDKLEGILKALVSMPQLNNDYHEFYKLKIIDRIIHLYVELDISISNNIYIKEIVNYVEENKSASHLIGMYSKIYLSLALYYSKSEEKKYNLLSQEYYSLFTSIDDYTLLNSEYKNIDNRILKNYASYFLQNIKNKDLMNNDDLILIGRKNVTHFLNNREFGIKSEINQKITLLINQILNNEVADYQQINELLDDIFTKNLFYGLVIVNIEKENHVAYEVDDIGYEHLFIKLNDEYKLTFYYSKAYENIFNILYSNNKEYIENNMNNILNSYIKSIPTYTDETTKLPNLSKLQNDLKTRQNDIVFIELYIDSLINISNTYPYKISNQYFNLIVDQLKSINKLYKLTGPRLGIIVGENDEYKELVNKIKDIEVYFEDERHIVSFTIAVSFGKSGIILDKSHYCLSAAKLNRDSYHEFK
ncbi:hypothetical protein A9Q76_02760 [Arcobacter sp. 31_11_sub10_T18]|nr:hypothetical protein A9Q76_02760 [Arcobacter sp. 31_11_sub10_T18]